MNVRKLETEEHGMTRFLYEEAFPEDSQAFTDYYYTEKTKNNQIYVLEEEGKICSMAHLNPYFLFVNGSRKETHYIVAVATKKECRGQGYMGTVLRRALEDMYREGEIFTFLMPAAKGIYEPYDFRTVFEQTRPYVKDLEGWIQAGGKDCQELSEWASDSLKKSCQVYAVRDEDYYLRMLREYESDGGKLLLKRDAQGKITDFGIWVPEEHPEQGKIMVRILDVRRMLMSLELSELTGVCFTVTDPIIEDNNRCLTLMGTEFSGVMLMDAKPENSEGVISVRALADLVFGVKSIEELRKEEGVSMSDRMAGELEKLLPLSEIYLNEMV